jgi:hypothetical protein
MNTVSLLAASWVHSVNGLIVLQGIFPGDLNLTRSGFLALIDSHGQDLPPLFALSPLSGGFPSTFRYTDLYTYFNSTSTCSHTRWFDAKKGTAIGIVFSGGGVGGVVSTFQTAGACRKPTAIRLS